ncbi:MAG: MerR family transcriptional regulator [Oscillospiraceae bacterium]|nr:MerR family transcriptional regulator [Oscillospiraceae bacterium]
MFKIGEFSKMVRVSARMLRYYERNGLLCPTEVDRFTGYRMYSAAQIPLLSRIVALRDMGFGVEEIKALLPCFDDTAVMLNALERKSREIHSLIADEQSKLEKIAALRGKFAKEHINMVYEVELKSLSAERVLSLREIIPTPEEEPALWEKLSAFVGGHGIEAAVVGYSIYHDGDYKESDVDVEIAVPVPKFGTDEGNFRYKELPAIPQAATIRFSGPYEGYSEAMEKLAGWVEKNGYAFDGSIRGLAIKSYANAENPIDFLTELQVPVRKA